MQHLVTLVRIARLDSQETVAVALAGGGEVFAREVLDADAPYPLNPVAVFAGERGVHPHVKEGGLGVGEDQQTLAAETGGDGESAFVGISMAAEGGQERSYNGN